MIGLPGFVVNGHASRRAPSRCYVSGVAVMAIAVVAQSGESVGLQGWLRRIEWIAGV